MSNSKLFLSSKTEHVLLVSWRFPREPHDNDTVATPSIQLEYRYHSQGTHQQVLLVPRPYTHVLFADHR